MSEQQEPRKATDVLLAVESKIELLLGLVRSLDLNVKISSNKLNEMLTKLEKQANKITVETNQVPMMKPNNIPSSFTQLPAGDPSRNIPISAESTIPETNAPDGFRRNSRPETYAGKNEIKAPIQIPKMPNAQIMVPPPGRSVDQMFPDYDTEVRSPKSKRNAPTVPDMTQEQPIPQSLQGQVPVIQRCVDKNGKSIFLADVEIIDPATQQQIFKTRTNATGKWSASLNAGEYRVVIRKREAITGNQVEAIQDVRVKGDAKLELPMLIIK